MEQMTLVVAAIRLNRSQNSPVPQQFPASEALSDIFPVISRRITAKILPVDFDLGDGSLDGESPLSIRPQAAEISPNWPMPGRGLFGLANPVEGLKAWCENARGSGRSTGWPTRLAAA